MSAGQVRLHPEGSRAGVALPANVGHFGLERLVGKSVGVSRERGAELDAGDVAFVHVGGDALARGRGYLEHYGVGRHRLAKLDVALHHGSVERREDRIILELPREEIDRGGGLVAFLLRALQSLHRQDAAVHQRLVARDLRLRHRQARLRVLKPGARLPVVEPRDDVALAHFVAFVDQKFGDPAGDCRAEPGVIDRLDDAGRIDRLDRRSPRGMHDLHHRRLEEDARDDERHRSDAERRNRKRQAAGSLVVKGHLRQQGGNW